MNKESEYGLEKRTFDRLGALIFDEPKTFTFHHNQPSMDKVSFGDWMYKYATISADGGAPLIKFALGLMDLYPRIPELKRYCRWDDDSDYYLKSNPSSTDGDCTGCKHILECLNDVTSEHHELAYAKIVLAPSVLKGMSYPNVGLRCYEPREDKGDERMTEYKSCPFCGSKDIRGFNRISGTDAEGITCLGCGIAFIPTMYSRDICIQEWNRRVNE